MATRRIMCAKPCIMWMFFVDCCMMVSKRMRTHSKHINQIHRDRCKYKYFRLLFVVIVIVDHLVLLLFFFFLYKRRRWRQLMPWFLLFVFLSFSLSQFTWKVRSHRTCFYLAINPVVATYKVRALNVLRNDYDIYTTSNQ